MRLCPASTGFGYIVLAGRRFNHDVVVYPDGRVERREKSLSKPEADLYAHTPLSVRELEYYLARLHEKPDCIVVGTGQDGGMKVTREAMEKLNKLSSQGVRVIIGRTPELVRECRLIERGCRKPLIVIHVTC
jgi:hypothetical protein